MLLIEVWFYDNDAALFVYYFNRTLRISMQKSINVSQCPDIVSGKINWNFNYNYFKLDYSLPEKNRSEWSNYN